MKLTGYSPLVFEEGEGKVIKSYWVPDEWKKKEADFPVADRNLRKIILRRIREAQREFAVITYGDLWRKHVGSYWTEVMSEEESAMVQEVIDHLESVYRPVVPEPEPEPVVVVEPEPEPTYVPRSRLRGRKK